MIAHILYYFSDQGELVLDPMAGGGVVADTCLAFNRKCWSFDMDDRPDRRPKIEPYFWDITNLKWPIKGKTKPDLIIFDPPASPEGEADGGQVRLILKNRKTITILMAYPDYQKRTIWNFWKAFLRWHTVKTTGSPIVFFESPVVFK